MFKILRRCLLLSLLALSAGPANAAVLTLEQVLARAVAVSHDVRLSEVDVKLNKNDVLRKRTDYLPNIVAHMNTEYLRDLTNDQTQVAVVNNTIIPNTTRYQTSINFATSWNVIDFGARSKAVLAAKEHLAASKHATTLRQRDVKIATIDAYSECLMAFKNVANKAKILDYRREVYACKVRLFEAGSIPKLDVSEAALASSEAVTVLVHAKYDYVEKLKELSEFTHDIYDTNSTEVADFDAVPAAPLDTIALRSTPDYKFFDKEIASKRAELKALERQRYPQIGCYSNFYLYGFNQYRFFQTFKDLRPVTISFGISVNAPIFDQLKNYSERQRKRLEIERLEVERDKKLWELEQNYQQTSQIAKMHKIDADNKQEALVQQSVKAQILGRLAQRRLVEKSEEIVEKIEIAEQELELQKSQVQLQAHVRKLKTLAEG